jgi:phage terminase large subunit-like protein
MTQIIKAPPDRIARLAELQKEAKQRKDPHLAWLRCARPDQILPGGDWRILYYQGGRGSGKTRSGTQGLAQLIREHEGAPADWGIIAPTYQAAWTTCVEGPSGILAAFGTSMAEINEHRSSTVKSAYRTYGEITLHSGHVLRVDSANDGALRVQGKNLAGAYCSEIGLWTKWSTAWDESIAYAVRLGASKIIACGTPKISRPAAKLIRRLLSGEPGVIVRRLRTVDNLANLSGAFYEAIVARASGTRLERQELEGELLDDVEHALWTRDLLHAIQVDEIPGADEEHLGLHTVYVGVDPSDGGEESDEQAYCVMGQGPDYKLYVAESWGGRIGPVPFLKKAVLAAARWKGTLVVEKNHGGAFLLATLQQVMSDLGVHVPYMMVHASIGKRSRAEPVAAMYERGVVRHLGPFVDLEDQMATFTGAARERSPDRLDSLCWAATPFLNYDFGPPKPWKPGARRWQAANDLDKMAGPSTLFRRRIIAGNYGEKTTRQPGAWDLDTFAPQDDDGRTMRPNVKVWS